MAGAAVVGVGALAGAGALADPINDQRSELQLSLSEIEDALPPDAVLTQAFLGTFRGLAVNVLWQRAEQLKQDGKFFEAMQLADWITTLQPRYPKVWEFTSWNNAYNISVATHTPQERWQWVSQGGIDQLRDKGIFYNPESPALYRQLAWIFLHKVGEFQDDYNPYYKRELAREWDNLLGGGPPVSGDMGEYAAWLRPVVEAPGTLAELYERTPEARRLVDHLRGRGYVLSDDEVGPNLLPDFAHEYSDFHPEDESEPHFHLEASEGEGVGLVTYARWPDWADDDTKQAVLAFARRKVITGSPYRMDPAQMLADAERFGPLDWRHQASHAIYWTMRGLERAEARYGVGNAPDEINTRRNLLMAIQQLQRSGRIQFEPQTGYARQLQDFSYATKYLDEMDRAIADYDGAGMDRMEIAERFYGSGFRNNMDQVISQLYLYGDGDRAQGLVDRMRARYAGTIHQERYAVPLEQMVQAHLDENFENPDQARSTILNLLTQALVDGYGEGRTERANRLIAQAERGHAWYKREYAGATTSEEVPPMPELIVGAAIDILARPPGSLDPRTKITLWENLPDEYKRRAWPVVYPVLAQNAQAFGYDMQTAFPAPEGAAEVPQPQQPQDDGPTIERQ